MLKKQLRAALTHAMKARDKTAVAAYRSALAAIDNAEAADLAAAPAEQPGRIAGGVAGLGAGEVPRRELTHAEMNALLVHEVDDRRAHADVYEWAGQHAEAETLRAQAALLAVFLDQ